MAVSASFYAKSQHAPSWLIIGDRLELTPGAGGEQRLALISGEPRRAALESSGSGLQRASRWSRSSHDSDTHRHVSDRLKPRSTKVVRQIARVGPKRLF